MTIIVRHKRTRNEYILLGINGIDRKPNLSPRSIGDLFSQDNATSSTLMTLCDVRGNIFLADMEDLTVVKIDGQKLSEILPEVPVATVNNEYPKETQEDLEEDFDDDDDGFDDNTSQPSAVTSTYSQTPSKTEDFDDDEDWI